jgi:hypothetical protein
MGMDYRRVINGLGLKSLVQPIKIPNAELGIETGEDLKPQQMKVQYQNPRNFVVIPQPTTWEKYQVDGHSKPVDQTTLPKDYWFGDPKGDF